MKSALFTLVTIVLLISAGIRAFAAPVNVNTADALTLAESLNGIGPKLAAAIVDYREANGDFQAIDDLLNVKGVGPKVLERNKADILIVDQKPKPTEE